MEFKGSKGEWKTRDTTNRVMIHAGEDKAICDVWGSSVSSVTHKEMIANAKLIAAAPELLEALDSINEELSNFHKEENYTLNTNHLLKVSTKAINKALK